MPSAPRSVAPSRSARRARSHDRTPALGTTTSSGVNGSSSGSRNTSATASAKGPSAPATVRCNTIDNVPEGCDGFGGVAPSVDVARRLHAHAHRPRSLPRSQDACTGPVDRRPTWPIGGSAGHTETVTATLVYDGDCGICQASVDVLVRLGCRAAMVPSHDWLRTHPDDADRCAEAVVLVTEDGTVLEAERAVAGALRLSREPGPIAGRVIDAPGVRRLAGLVYRRVAANRTRLSAAFGLDTCAVPTTTGEPAAPEPAS